MYTLGQLPGVPVAPELASEAAAYISARVREFRALGPRLLTMQHQAALIAGRAKQAGDDAAYVEAQERRAELADVWRDWGAVMDRLDGLLAKVPGLGLPVIPLALAAAAVAIAGAMALIFRRATAAEEALDLVARGVLTPDEAERLARERGGGLFGGLADAAKYAALAVGLYFGLPLVARALR